MRSCFHVLTCMIFSWHSLAFADGRYSLGDPELQVVPRASERLLMDSYRENEHGWSALWPFHLAAATTLTAALLHKGKFKDESINDDTFRKYADFKVNAAIGLSISWFAFTYLVSSTKPYTSELNKINKLKGNDRRTTLLRERLSEEAIENSAELFEVLSYASTATNVIAAAGLVDVANENDNVYAAIAMMTAFLPLIFKNHYIENYEKHLEYKRKIYAPIVFSDFFRPSLTSSWAPRLVLQWNF